MEAGHFTDALSVAFFALLGLWAGAVRGHWFLRAATVSALLMTTLLIPAHELVIEFGLQMVVIALAISLARGHKFWRSQWSLETALLATVVLAVVFAIVGSLPDFTLPQWLGMFGVGLVTPLFALLSVWLVYSRASLARRIMGGAIAITLLLVVLQLGDAVRYAFNTSRGWRASFLDFYDPAYISIWLAWNLQTVAIGLTAMIVTLIFARASGWFAEVNYGSKVDDPQLAAPDAHLARVTTRMQLARLGLLMMFASIGLPLLYVLYRLLTPPPLPQLNSPSPNGYHDIIAAGSAAPEELEDIQTFTLRALSLVELQRLAQMSLPVTVQIEAALQKECWVADPFIDWNHPNRAQELAGMRKAYKAVAIWSYHAKHFGAPSEVANAALLTVRYGHAMNRGMADLSMYSAQSFEAQAIADLQRVMGQLSAQECRRAAATLFKIDQAREPLSDVTRRQRIAEMHRGWDSHLRCLLDEWSGREAVDDPQALLRDEDYYIAQVRLLVVDLGLQAFALERKRIPESLDELAPDYLPAMPLDSLSGEPFVYRPHGGRYILYSVGWDRDDDGGRIGVRNDDSDIVTSGPHGPPRWLALRDLALDKLREFWHTYSAP